MNFFMEILHFLHEADHSVLAVANTAQILNSNISCGYSSETGCTTAFGELEI